jgi:hypothetical protein
LLLLTGATFAVLAIASYRAYLKRLRKGLMGSETSDDVERVAEIAVQDQAGEEILFEEFPVDGSPLILSIGPNPACDLYVSEGKTSATIRIHPEGSVERKSLFSWTRVDFGDGIDLGNGTNAYVLVDERPREQGGLS